MATTHGAATGGTAGNAGDRHATGAGREGPHAGEVHSLGVAGERLYENSLDPGVARVQLSPGDEVVLADDARLGEVRFVRPNCVVVSRAGKPDVYVPHDALLSARDRRVVVNTLATQLDHLGW
jgi:hypothetical protein